MLPTIVSFVFYLVVLIAIGIMFYEKKSSVEKYILGGRGLGSWVTAMSAQASDMSGWLLMGLPGCIYAAQIGETWTAIGLALGTFFNWVLIAPRLRVYTEVLDSVTVPSYMGMRFHDPTKLLRVLGALVTLLFFSIYAGSGLVAAGKLFEEMFNLNYTTSVLVGGVVILFYTLCGGYLAVCWTDLIQGILMFIAVVIVPILAVMNHIPEGAIAANCEARNIVLNIFPEQWSFAAVLAILSPMAWGLGYFGQPHIIVRFMGIRSHHELKKATIIAMIWVLVSLACALLIGLVGIGMYTDPKSFDAEKIFIKLIGDVCNPWVGGIFLAAIMAAIMSTIDSQLLSASSALSQDFYQLLFRKNAGEREMVNVNRAFVLLIMVISTTLALADLGTIFVIVKFAWAGFGAAFGPIILMSLYSRKMTWQSALAGMVVGTAVMLIWAFSPLKPYMYELLPGFLANILTVYIINLIKPQKQENILQEYDKMLEILHEPAPVAKEG